MRQFLFSHHSSNYVGVAYSGFGVLGHWWVIPYTTIHMNTIIHMINIIWNILMIYLFGLFSQFPSVPDCTLKIPRLLLHGFMQCLLLPLLCGIISWTWPLWLYGILPLDFQLRPKVRGSVLFIPSRSLIINLYFCNTYFLLKSNLYYICVDKNNCWCIWLCKLQTIDSKLLHQKDKEKETYQQKIRIKPSYTRTYSVIQISTTKLIHFIRCRLVITGYLIRKMYQNGLRYIWSLYVMRI